MKQVIQKSLFILLSLITSNLIAQERYINTSYGDAVSIQKRILLVGLEEEKQDALTLYQNEPEDLARYKNFVAGKNLVLKKSITNLWTFSSEIQYLPITEAKKLMKEQKEKYALIHYADSWSEDYFIFDERPEARNAITGWKKKNDSLFYNVSCRYVMNNMVVTNLMITLPKKAIEVLLPNLYPSEGDLIYAIQRMQYMLRYVLVPGQSMNHMFQHIPDHSGILKEKILLIDINTFLPGIKKEEMLAAYKYPFLAVQYQVIEKALKEKDPRYAVLTIYKETATNAVHVISDAADGTIYFSRIFPAVDYPAHMEAFAYVYPHRITLNDLSIYSSNIK